MQKVYNSPFSNLLTRGRENGLGKRITALGLLYRATRPCMLEKQEITIMPSLIR